MKFNFTAFAATLVLACPSGLTAEEVRILDIVDEVRLGGHFHSNHWTMLPGALHEWDLSRPEDFSFDVLFRSPDIDVFRLLGSPRPEVGTTINTSGRDTLIHLGLTWQLPVFDTALYLEGTFGAAIHNGFLANALPG